MLGAHAESDAAFDLQVHGVIVAFGQPLTECLSVHGEVSFSQIFTLLLLQDSLQDSVATYFVHVENFVRYNALDTLLRQVINGAPVRVFLLHLLFESTSWVLGDVGPLSAHGQLLKESRITLLDHADLLFGVLIFELV